MREFYTKSKAAMAGPGGAMAFPRTLEKELRSLFAHTAQSGNHLQKTLSDLLVLAKLESGSASNAKSSVDPELLIHAVSRKFARVLRQKELKLDVSMDGAAGELLIDLGQVETLLFKMVENAIEFSPLQGSIGISGKPTPDGHGFTMTVCDEGPGIAEADQAIIFESFRQLEGGHTRSHPGVGVGLAIAQRIAEAHGTRVELKSVVGEGSTFSVTLPVTMTNV